jgi:hypothetical protein
MSLVLTFPGRRLVLAMGDRHGAYQNERSSFVFSVTANNFGHRCSCSSNHSTFRATTSSVNTLNPVNLAWAKRRGYRNVSRVPPSRDQAPITPRPIALTPAWQMERSVRIRRFSRVGRFTQSGRGVGCRMKRRLCRQIRSRMPRKTDHRKEGRTCIGIELGSFWIKRPKGEEQPHDDFLIQRAAGGSFSSVRMLISRQIEAFHYQP